MENLKKILQLVNSRGVTPIKNFTNGEKKGEKLYTFYKGIEDGTFTTDEEAAEALYNSHPSDKRYLMLRRKLIETLALTLSQYDYSGLFTTLPTRTLICYQLLFAVKVLQYFGARTTAIKITEWVLKEAEECHITDVRMQCYRILRDNAAFEGDRRLFQEYNFELKKALILYEAELESEEECQKIDIHFAKSATPRPDLAEQAELYIERLEKERSQVNSYTIEMNRLRILIHIYQSKKEFHQVVEICSQAEAYLDANPGLSSRGRYAEFALGAMNACLKLKDYGNALEYATKCSKLYTEGRSNWYLVMGRIMMMTLRRGEYLQALDTYQRAVGAPGFNELSDYQKSRWALFGAYVTFAFESGLAGEDSELVQTISRSRRISELWRHSTEITKDKQGMNVALLIIQILHMIHHRDLDQLETRLVLLQKYVKRHLDKAENLRTVNFIEALIHIVRVKFISKKAQLKSREYYQDMISSSKTDELIMEDIEIIPYERLLDWLIEQKPAR